MVDISRPPARSSMTVVTGIAALDMAAVLASGLYAIMAGGAGTGH